MKTVKLGGYLESVKAQKAKLEPDSGVLFVESCRNGGARRTASKRSALKRADARAKAAGVQPILANY
jgi:hypothetical protein